jgi:hypothetical protein
MNKINLNSIKMKKFAVIITALLFETTKAILTALRPVTQSSTGFGISGSNVVDNNFDTF